MEFCSHHPVVLIATPHYGYTLSKLSTPRGTAVSSEMPSFNAPQNYSFTNLKGSNTKRKTNGRLMETNQAIDEDTLFE